jgi:hypothetical protein
MKKEISNIFHYAKVEKIGTSGYLYHLDNGNIPDVQDCYGMSNLDQIISYWESINRQQREILTQIICRTQAPDTFVDFLKTTVLKTLSRKIEDQWETHYRDRGMTVERREDELYQKEEIFRNSKKSIYKRIRKLQLEKQNLQFRMDNTEKQNRDLWKDNHAKNKQLHQYSKIKQVLNLIADIQSPDDISEHGRSFTV